MNGTAGRERSRIAGIVDAGLIRVQSIISAALLERVGTLNGAICNVNDLLPVEASSDGSGPAAGAFL